jgi:hypothetical protein
MGVTGVRLIGTKIVYKHLTLKTLKEDPKEYAIQKLLVWNKMLSDQLKPTKWNRPNKNGTGVTSEMLTSINDIKIAFDELGRYIQFVNKEYQTEYALNKKEEKTVEKKK